MARPLRLDYPGALWHVTTRGNARQPIFLDDGDRRSFLTVLGRVAETFRWLVYAWVLMENHYHLVVETLEGTLSRGMRQLNGVYTQRFNTRHSRVGHLLQGRFKSILVEREAHLLELVRYVMLNPVRAGLVGHPRDHRWSSYRALIGSEPAPSWLGRSSLLAHFGDHDVRRAERQLAAYVLDGIDSAYRPSEQVVGQVFLGDEAFVMREAARVTPDRLSREHPGAQRRAGRPGLDALVDAVASAFGTTAASMRKLHRGPARKALAYLGRSELALHLSELGPVLGVAHWSVSNLARAGEQLAETSEGFRRQLDLVRVAIRNRAEVAAGPH